MTPTHSSTPTPIFAGAPAPSVDRAAVGRARVEARTRRTRMIRRRVAAWSAGLFAAAWLGIAVQLVSGHDPALSHSTTSTSVSSGVTSSNTSDSSGGSGLNTSSSGSSNSSSGSSNNSSGSGSSLTTRQS